MLFRVPFISDCLFFPLCHSYGTMSKWEYIFFSFLFIPPIQLSLIAKENVCTFFFVFFQIEFMPEQNLKLSCHPHNRSAWWCWIQTSSIHFSSAPTSSSQPTTLSSPATLEAHQGPPPPPFPLHPLSPPEHLANPQENDCRSLPAGTCISALANLPG